MKTRHKVNDGGGLTAKSASEGRPASGRPRLRLRRRDGLGRLRRVDVALHRRRHEVVVVQGRVDGATVGHGAPRPARLRAERTCHAAAAAAAETEAVVARRRRPLSATRQTASDVALRRTADFIRTRRACA